MSVQAFRFGPSGRQLFGAYHPASGPSRRHTVALLCAPFGQEALRAQRPFRVLAERLARAGIAVLRFDYYGTGDSDGASEEGDLDCWTRDIAVAHDELARLSSSREIAWVGLGLGANLGMLSSVLLREPLAHFVAWEPILSGADYLEALQSAHLSYLEAELPSVAGAPPAVPANAQDQGVELIGFPVSQRLLAQFRGLDARNCPRPAAIGATILSSTGDAQPIATRWSDAGLPVAMVALRPWAKLDSDDIIASGILPTDILDSVQAALEPLP